MLQLLVFLAILSVVVLIHELGHFFAAKKAGVRVDEFGFGLPPKLFTLFKKGGTEFTVNALPIGGFVKLYGENGEVSELGVPDERSFGSKKLWQRGIILIAGVLMNFALGIFLFSVVYSFLGVPAKINGAKIVEVQADTPAAMADIQVGDLISNVKVLIPNDKSITNVKISNAKEFTDTIAANKGKEVILVVTRGEENKEFKVTPRLDPPAGQGALGVVISDSELRHYPWYEMPFRGAYVGTQEAWAWGKEIVANFYQMIYRLVTGQGISRDLAGPVGIYQISGQVQKQGLLAVLQFAGVLSVNLAILNIMPFPALDGGRVVFLVLELIRGKKVKEEIEGWVNTIGMLLLLLLMAVITINDLSRLGVFSSLFKMFGR